MATTKRRDNDDTNPTGSEQQGAGDNIDAGSAAQTQAQTASAEPEQLAETSQQRLEGAGDDERQFFEGTVVKVDAEGNEVMSDHLAPGEKLRRATTDAYATDKRQERREASDEQSAEDNR